MGEIEGQVTVFSREGCVQCTATYRALDARGIAYQVVYADADVASELAREGWLQLPVVKTTAAGNWAGFRPDRIDELAGALS